MLWLLIIVCSCQTEQGGHEDFLSAQMKHERVRAAYSEKNKLLLSQTQKKNIALEKIEIIILAFKAEQILEIHARNSTNEEFKKLTEYHICMSSGKLGPKRKKGDEQVPEGFYHINRFNPQSSYYLSLGINYPNDSDRRKSAAANLGGDIFIHGNCVTVGCLPMTDDKMKEIYLYAVHAKSKGQAEIPVYFFPFRMNQENFKQYSEEYKVDLDLINFWLNLKIGYDLFFEHQQPLQFDITNDGDYCFESSNKASVQE